MTVAPDAGLRQMRERALWVGLLLAAFLAAWIASAGYGRDMAVVVFVAVLCVV